MAKSTYQNHFLQRGRFNAGSAPKLKKSSDPNMTALGLTALRLAPAVAPYAKKLYNMYETGRASDYVDNLVNAGIADPSIISPGSADKYAYAAQLEAAQKKKMLESLTPKDMADYTDQLTAYDDARTMRAWDTIDKVDYSPEQQAFSYDRGLTGASPDAFQPMTDVTTMPLADSAQYAVPSYIDTSSVYYGVPDAAPVEWMDAGVAGNYAPGLGDWSGISAGVDPSQAVSWDASVGDFVGPGTGTDGMGGSWGDGLGGAGFAGGMSAASDILSGRDINVGKAAGSAAGAYGGAALGTAIFPGAGTVVGGALGSMFGGALGGGGGGGSVICTELNRQQLLPDAVYTYDHMYGASLDENVIRGYHWWAVPLTKRMANSKLLTHILLPFARSWAYTVASKINPTEFKPRLLGKILLAVGVPICKVIGKYINHRDSSRRIAQAEAK